MQRRFGGDRCDSAGHNPKAQGRQAGLQPLNRQTGEARRAANFAMMRDKFSEGKSQSGQAEKLVEHMTVK
jgi:hypothetical protein